VLFASRQAQEAFEEAKYKQVKNEGWEVIPILSVIGSHAQEVI